MVELSLPDILACVLGRDDHRSAGLSRRESGTSGAYVTIFNGRCQRERDGC